VDYSKTINLPRPSISMKANLPHKEPELLQFWEELRFYQKLREERKGAPQYILHDGPPYSNGHIHMGTALNKVAKDIVVRSKSMAGYDSPYIPGWDNHGMPIEIEATKSSGQGDRLAVRRSCREYARKFVNVQREEFKRLGVMGQWDEPYLTMSPKFEAKIIDVFGELAEKGYIYRGLRPIDWCPHCRTALAEAEIEYKEKESDSILVRFPLLKDPQGIFAGAKEAFVLIWTTTPWTIPANQAVVVNPEFAYVVALSGSESYLVAEELLPQVMRLAGKGNYRAIKRIKGEKLQGLVFKHPLFDRPSPLFLADHVTLEEGTGIVHTAPGHGEEDFEVGKREELEVLSVVDEAGVFNFQAGKYSGLSLEQGNAAVLRDLLANGNLLHHTRITHKYPHCWRCHQPLIFRATVQWFLSVDHLSLRKKALAAIEKVKWVPSSSRNRIISMMEGRPDWCLSRQRNWGVGIPVFYCQGCGREIIRKDLIERVRDLVAQKGSDVWFELPAEELLPPDFRCPYCGGREFEKEKDILDVWFDSGCSHLVVLEGNSDLRWPADLYLEGTDQHRGWFNQSLLISMAIKGFPPYRTVVTNGWMLDAQGKAMHKSRGNVISPMEIYNKYGADILRLWVASTEFTSDMKLSPSIIQQVVDAYRRIRNTFRFLLGNLYDFSPGPHLQPRDGLLEIDRFILQKLGYLVKEVLGYYERFEFHKIYHVFHNFCAVDLSAFYLDVLKDRMYTWGKDSLERRSGQTAFYLLANSLAKLIAPIMPFTAEEIWEKIPYSGDRPESIHLTLFPDPDLGWFNPAEEENWRRLLQLRDVVLKGIEIMRGDGLIGNSLEARVTLEATDPGLREILERYEGDLPTLFICSQVELSPLPRYTCQDEGIGLKVLVGRAQGGKCVRCWNYSPTVGEDEDFPGVCARCAQVLREGWG